MHKWLHQQGTVHGINSHKITVGTLMKEHVTQCNTVVHLCAFNGFWTNNGALCHRGIRQIRLQLHRLVCWIRSLSVFSLLMGIVDKRKNPSPQSSSSSFNIKGIKVHSFKFLYFTDAAFALIMWLMQLRITENSFNWQILPLVTSEWTFYGNFRN